MALRGTLTHRKTRRLARILGIAPCFALGILEAMWHVTATQAPTGAIGRIPDEDLADQLGYTACEKQLVRALMEAGFLDESKPHRLIVHDWHVHSDNTLDAQLMRQGLRYANGVQPRGTKISNKPRRGEAKGEYDQLIEKFYTAPPASLFEEKKEAAAAPAEMPDNVVVFPAALGGAARRLPEPEPVPDPVPVPEPEAPPKRTLLTLTGTCREIVCAYPASVLVGMSPLEVPKDQVAQVEAAVLHEAKKSDCDPALAAEYLLGQTRAFAEAVAQWPPGEQRFVPKLRNWLAEYQYRRSEEEWRRGTHRQRDGTYDGGGGGAARSAAAERWSAGDDAFRSVYADLVPARTG